MNRDIFCKCHVQNTSKEVFRTKKVFNSMYRFKSAILAIFQFWQNGTFELMHGIQIIFDKKTFFESRMMVSQSRKLRFSQKGLARFQIFFSIWVHINTYQDWSAKLESGSLL